MKGILVLGSAGMLGYAVSEYFSRKDYSVKNITRNEFDAADPDVSKLETYITGKELVINCIGVIKQVIDEFSAIDTIKINGIFPRNLAKLCKRADVPMIHITTDCAYSGKKGNYSENDLFDAEDLYGISKIAGENNDCMTLRTSIIGPERNTNRSLLGWALSRKGETVNGFTNHKWNGVTTVQFAEVTEQIMNENLYEEGIFHVHSPGVVSKYELLEIFNRVFGLGMTVTKTEAPENCDRTLNSIYPLSGKLSIAGIGDQVKKLKEFFKL